MFHMARYEGASYDLMCMHVFQDDKKSIGSQGEAAGSLQASRSSLL